MQEKILSRFVDTVTPVLGLTPLVTIRRTDNVLVVDAEPMVEIGNGWYEYVFVDYVLGTTYLVETDGGDGCPDSCKLQSNINDIDTLPPAVKETLGKTPLAPLIQGQNGQQIKVDLEGAVAKITKEIKAIPKVDFKTVTDEIKNTGENIIKKVDAIDIAKVNKVQGEMMIKISDIVAWKDNFNKEYKDSFDRYVKATKEAIDNIDISKNFDDVTNSIKTMHSELLDASNKDNTDYTKLDITTPITNIQTAIAAIPKFDNKEYATVMESVVMKGINMVIDCVMDMGYDKEQQSQIIQKLDELKKFTP